jgi:hypothetical protein
MVGHGSKFGRKMEEAVANLLTHRNVEEAAKATDVSTATLLRWIKVPEFEKAYREARRAAYGHATARLQQESSAAVSALLKVLVDAASPASARVRAADCILDHAKEAIELEDIEARVRELEATVKSDGVMKR